MDAEAAKMPAEVPLEAERVIQLRGWQVGPVGSAMVFMLEKTGLKKHQGFRDVAIGFLVGNFEAWEGMV